MRFALLPLVAISLASISAYAQDATRLPGVIDKNPTATQEKISTQLNQDAADVSSGETPAKLPIGTGGPIVLKKLKEVLFSGNHTKSSDELAAVISEYYGKSLTNNDISSIKYKITKAYYDAGYPLVKAVTPPQSLKNGTLSVKIYEASIDNVKIQQDGLVADYVANGYADMFTKKAAFNEKAAESIISDLNALKGLQSTLALMPGSSFGTTDLGIIIREADDTTHRFSIDNYGSELTGEGVATLELEYGNLMGLGETLSLDARRSNDDLWSAGVGFDAPIGYQNMILELSYLHNENEIGGSLASLQASGASDIFTLALSKNLLHTQSEKRTVRFGFEAKNHRSFIQDVTETKDNIRQLFLEGSWLKRLTDITFYTSAKVKKGTGFLGGRDEGAGYGIFAGTQDRASRENGNPDAWIFEPIIFASYLTPIGGELTTLVTGQLSSDSLLSSDSFAIGGFGSVRGFEPAKETGDRGVQVSVEYLHEIDLLDNTLLRAGPWLDAAHVSSNQSNISLDEELVSVGLGVEASAGLTPYGDTKLRVDVAFPVGSYDDTNVADSTVYFKLSQEF